MTLDLKTVWASIDSMKKHQAWLHGYLSQLPLGDDILEKLETDLLRHISQALERQREDTRREISTIKQWVFTAPYGIEVDEHNKPMPRLRSDEEYLKASEVFEVFSDKTSK